MSKQADTARGQRQPQVSDEQPQIGVDADDVEETDEAVAAAALGFDVADVDPDHAGDDLERLVDELGDRDVDPIVATILERLVDDRRRLQEENEDLQETVDEQRETIKELTGMVNRTQDRVDELEEREERTHESVKSAFAKIEQMSTESDHQEDAEELPTGVEPSTSPLDFFANCRQLKIKKMFVEDSNRSNKYRAVAAAKRWPEFAHERHDGSGIFWTRDDLEDALTAILDGPPHRETVRRVWDDLVDLGGGDVVEKTRQISSRQEPTDIITMDRETAEKLLDKRYVGMDLLDGSESKAQTGGVTPVVTGAA